MIPSLNWPADSTLVGNSQLRILDLCRSKITDNSLFRIIQLRELEEIRLPWCAGITDAGIVAVVQSCTKLKVIDLRSCSITDVALQAIGSLCSRLRELDLSWCFAVSNEGLQKLIPTVGTESTLEKLSLIWCPQVTDTTLLLLSGIHSLQSIQLGGCAGITKEGTSHLSEQGIEIIL